MSDPFFWYCIIALLATVQLGSIFIDDDAIESFAGFFLCTLIGAALWPLTIMLGAMLWGKLHYLRWRDARSHQD